MSVDILANLRKQVIDLQVLSLKKNCSPDAYLKIRDDIRHQAAELLHSLDPSLSYQEHYSGPVVCDPTGDFKANVAFISRLRLTVDKLSKASTASEGGFTEPLRGTSVPPRNIGSQRRSSSPSHNAISERPRSARHGLAAGATHHDETKDTIKDSSSCHALDTVRLEKKAKNLADSISQMKYKIQALKEELSIDDIEDQYKNTEIFLAKHQRISQRLESQENTYRQLLAYHRELQALIPELEREKDAMLTEACIKATEESSAIEGLVF
ncbi:Hypothetical protein GLP15_4460 [Giardia lamblia P15]|uniref:Uncharacterized protein n=1 Tax=Giardia intestinalis (strain P15) TaxID=658858 RepID=E1F5M7_GIAIA|nr:Hypothetical protein GLP15_4460 [Giardia lamblia P15]